MMQIMKPESLKPGISDGKGVIMRLKMFIATFLIVAGGSAYAQDSILDRYRASGGMLPVEAESLDFENSDSIPTSPLATGREASPRKIEGFNDAVDQAFPMTPEMIERFRQITKEHERATQERQKPQEEISTTLVSLEPGEPSPLLKVSPSIATVLGFYDATGAAWPITQYVLGDNSIFVAQHLGEKSNNLVLTPGSRIGFTNLVVLLQDHDKPVVIDVNISEDFVHYRFDIQVTQLGPKARANNATAGILETVPEAGDSLLLAAITGVDLPIDAKRISIDGVDARGWLVDGALYVRSRNALLSPAWSGSMAGPDGVRVYRIEPGPVALFSVGGQIVRADIQIP